METIRSAVLATPAIQISQSAAYSKSRELLGLVYGEGFGQAKTAYTYEMFTENLREIFPRASQGQGRVASSDEHVFWMQDERIVGIWSPQMMVGVTGYFH